MAPPVEGGGEAGAGAAVPIGEIETTTGDDAAGDEVAGEVPLPAPWLKDPPPVLGTGDEAGVEAVGLGDPLAPGDAPAPPDPEPLSDVTLLSLQPTGGCRPVFAPLRSTEAPGLGMSRTPLAVLHPEPMLATNMSGNSALLLKPGAELRAMCRPVSRACRFLAPPVTVTGAQFMYISLLPILLNHVQAST